MPGSGFLRSVIWRQLRCIGVSGLDPVGEYFLAIRNRAEHANFIWERSVYEPAEIRHRLRRQRHRILRSKIPLPSDEMAAKTSSRSQLATHSNTRNCLMSFWRAQPKGPPPSRSQ